MEAGRRALKFHIQSAIACGSERNTNNVASIGNGKTGKIRISKDRAAFGLGDDIAASKRYERMTKLRPREPRKS